MPLEYIEQSTKKLNYFFVATPFDIKNKFKIIKKKKIILSFGKLFISIIGESHLLKFENADVCLTEILACIKNKYYLNKISINSFSLAGIKKNLVYKYKNKDFSYSFCIKKEKAGYPLINKLFSKIKKGCSDNNLLFEWYDKNKAGYTVPSFTFIKYKFLSGNLVKINTLHFYKKEFFLISTVSYIKIKFRPKAYKTKDETTVK